MRVSERVECEAFPCADVKHNGYVVPGINLKPEAVSIVMVSESSPENPDDLTTTITQRVIRCFSKPPCRRSMMQVVTCHQ